MANQRLLYSVNRLCPIGSVASAVPNRRLPYSVDNNGGNHSAVANQRLPYSVDSAVANRRSPYSVDSAVANQRQPQTRTEYEPLTQSVQLQTDCRCCIRLAQRQTRCRHSVATRYCCRSIESKTEHSFIQSNYYSIKLLVLITMTSNEQRATNNDRRVMIDEQRATTRNNE